MLKYIIFSLFIVASLSNGGEIIQPLYFSMDDFTMSQIDGYDYIAGQDFFSTAKIGEPVLPVKTVSFLLPPTAEITSVEVLTSDRIELPKNYVLYPAQPVRPLSADREIPFVKPNPQIYESRDPYPARIIQMIPSGCLAGYRIGSILIHPLQYMPIDKKLILFKTVTLRIQYEEGRYEPVKLTPGQAELFSREVSGLVVNPEALDSWSPMVEHNRGGEVDYVIITSASLVSNWNALRDWKTKKGINTVVVRTDSIYTTYSGRDNQEKIRNFIKDWWQNKGLKYVLLGGDDAIIPDRKTRLVIEDSTTTGNIPTDMYYADLQWSWDGNNNNYFGEMADTVDLFHDVYIGRAPVDNATNISTFIRKDTVFEKRPDTTYIKKLLLPSEMLFDPYHGEVVNNIIASYYPSDWVKAKLKDPGSNATRDSLNQGYQLCHVSAHGSSTSLSVLSMSQIPGLTNSIKLDVMNGINCDVGSFDGQDCIAESLVNYPNGGCIATLMNSRYGLGYPPGLGPSEILDLGIFKAFIVSGIAEVGAMHARAKNDCRGMAMSQAPTRWCVFENTLFGDPGLALYSKKPATMSVAYASSIYGGPQVYRVSVSIAGSPLKGALVCAMKGTEVYSVGKTNSQGWVDLFINPTPGTMMITVTAKDCRPYEGTCSVSGSSANPCLTFNSCIVNDGAGNNNQRIDPGETVDLVVWLNNRGSAQANNVNGRLRTASPHVTLVDSTASYGAIASGDSAAGDNFRILVSSATPQGTEIEFTIFAQATEGTWEPYFVEAAGIAPDPRSVWVDHDTGCCVLSVTSYGGFGTTYPYGEGSGFKYSKLASYGSLYYGSMVCGNAANYIVDRFYGQPSSGINQDFRIADTLTPVLPPYEADEEYITFYSDSNHASPKGLKVRQWSMMLSSPGYDDFVIICFDYYNYGSAPLNNFYSGMMFDFDVSNYVSNIVRTNTGRRFTYMLESNSSQRPTVGIRLLEPTTAANLSAINNALYVEPASMMTEAVKDSFLKGLISLPNATTADNYSICVSAGPFNIPVGACVRAVYAVVGGDDTTQARIHSDSAQSWWNQVIVGADEFKQALLSQFNFRIVPNPASRNISIEFNVPQGTAGKVEVFDAAGRLVSKIFEGTINVVGVLDWRPDKMPEGVYFVKLTIPRRTVVEKFIYLK